MRTRGLALLLLSAALGVAAPMALAQTVDRTTPHAQNGLTLLALTRGDARGQYHFPVPANLNFLSGPSGYGPPGGLGLWVRGKAQAPAHSTPGRPSQMFGTGMPTATARAGGDTIPVQCQPSFAPGGPQTPAAPLYLLSLPAGYPNGYGPIDITLTDPQGRHAHWRLTHLPPSVHAIKGAAAPHSTFSHGGVTLTARAWRDNGPPNMTHFPNAADFRGIRYQIHGSVPAKSQWVVRITGRQLEWEPLPPNAQPQYPPGFHPPPGIPRPVFLTAFLGQNGPTGIPSQAQDLIHTPYGAHEHYLRLTGQLVRLATAQEPVTFHNLNIRPQANPFANARRMPGQPHRPAPMYTPAPGYAAFARPQTVTTPSGISITLLPFSSLPSNHPFFGGMPNSVQLALRFSHAAPNMAPVSLPRSPLARKYHKPITFTLESAPPYFLQNVFPVSNLGFGRPQTGAAQTYLATLVLPPDPAAFRRPPDHGAFTPPAMPKHLATLPLTITQRAELTSLPISFLVPIGNPPPPSAMFPPRRMLPPRH